MIQVFPCPACGTHSRLLHEASPAATIRCRNCGAEVVLGQIDLQQLAEWEILEDPLVEEAITSSSSYSSPLPSSATISSASSPAISLVESYSHSQYDRARRKRKSPIWSVVPIVLGGAAAFPLALLILWYGMGRDVGGMGPRIAEYAPWIVPKQFHPIATSKDSTSRNRTPPARGSSGFRSFDGVLPALPVENQVSIDADSVVTEATGASETTDAVREVSPTESPRVEAVASSDAEASSAVTAQDSGLPQLFADIESAEQLISALQQAMTSAASNRLELLVQLNDSLSGLAVQFHHLAPDSPLRRSVNDKMLNLVRPIKHDIPLQTVLNKLVERKSPDLIATTQPVGIVATLEISEAQLDGETWTVVAIHKLPSALSIQIPRALAPNLQVGSRWLALGTIFTDETSESEGLLKVGYLFAL